MDGELAVAMQSIKRIVEAEMQLKKLMAIYRSLEVAEEEMEKVRNAHLLLVNSVMRRDILTPEE